MNERFCRPKILGEWGTKIKESAKVGLAAGAIAGATVPAVESAYAETPRKTIKMTGNQLGPRSGGENSRIS